MGVGGSSYKVIRRGMTPSISLQWNIRIARGNTGRKEQGSTSHPVIPKFQKKGFGKGINSKRGRPTRLTSNKTTHRGNPKVGVKRPNRQEVLQKGREGWGKNEIATRRHEEFHRFQTVVPRPSEPSNLKPLGQKNAFVKLQRQRWR